MTKKIVQALFTLAKEFSHCMSDVNAEHLSYEEYAMLAEYETKLLAFGNLLSVTNVERFLADELRDAKDFLECIRLRSGVASDIKESAK